MQSIFYKACVNDDLLALKQHVTVENVNTHANFYTEESRPLLWMACRYQRMNIVKWLVESMHATISIDDLIQVIGQRDKCNIELVQYLLDHGVNVKNYSIDKRTTVLHAPLNSPCRVYELLLRSGADCNALDFYGITPLGAALRYWVQGVCIARDELVSNLECNVRLLMEAGARIDNDVTRVDAPQWALGYQIELDTKKERCVSVAAALQYCMRTRRGAPRDLTRYFLGQYVLPTQTNDVWLINNK